MVLSKRKAAALIPLPSLFGAWLFGTPAKERFSDVGKRRVVRRKGWKMWRTCRGEAGDINVFS